MRFLFLVIFMVCWSWTGYKKFHSIGVEIKEVLRDFSRLEFSGTGVGVYRINLEKL
jgi:hypothetical protein